MTLKVIQTKTYNISEEKSLRNTLKNPLKHKTVSRALSPKTNKPTQIKQITRNNEQCPKNTSTKRDKKGESITNTNPLPKLNWAFPPTHGGGGS